MYIYIHIYIYVYRYIHMSYRSLRYKYYIYLNTDVIYTWIHTLSNCFNLQGPSPSGWPSAGVAHDLRPLLSPGEQDGSDWAGNGLF